MVWDKAYPTYEPNLLVFFLIKHIDITIHIHDLKTIYLCNMGHFKIFFSSGWVRFSTSVVGFFLKNF